jgi:hypothetical protein
MKVDPNGEIHDFLTKASISGGYDARDPPSMEGVRGTLASSAIETWSAELCRIENSMVQIRSICDDSRRGLRCPSLVQYTWIRQIFSAVVVLASFYNIYACSYFFRTCIENT